MEHHGLVAIAELHVARRSMQSALLALDRAVGAGERIGETDLRVLDAELRGIGEEAAVVAALCSALRPRTTRGRAARRPPAPTPVSARVSPRRPSRSPAGS